MDRPFKNPRSFALFLFLSLLMFFVVGYFAQKRENIDINTGKTPTTACQTNSDCVVGIKPQNCCSCPSVINQELQGHDGWELYIQGKNYSKQKPEECDRVDCKPCETPTTPVCLEGQCVFTNDPTPQITDEELGQGWYWGFAEQKKSGTPNNWTFKDAGRSSCWHKPNVECLNPVPTSQYNCPKGGWVDCMPGPDRSLEECSDKAKEWYENNCPDFEGFAY